MPTQPSLVVAPSAPTQKRSSTSGVGPVTALPSSTSAVPHTTSTVQLKSIGNSASIGIQQPGSSRTTTSTPQQNGHSSSQPLISTIHSTTVVTKSVTPTSTSTSTIFPISTFSTPVVITQASQNGSTSVVTPSFVTDLTTSTNFNGSVVTSTRVYANPTANSSSQQETFFQNTGAVAGVFTVSGVVVLLIILCAVYLIRRSRRKRWQNEWLPPSAPSGRYGSPTMHSISSEVPSEVSRSRMIFPTQDNSRAYLPNIPVHVDIVQETEHYPPERGMPVEAPTNRPKMVSFTHSQSFNSPSVPIPSGLVRRPPEGPFTGSSVPNPNRLSLMRENGPGYLRSIPFPDDAGQVSRRLSIEKQGEALPTRNNATIKRTSMLAPVENVRKSQQSSTDIKPVDPNKWKVKMAASLAPTQRGHSKADEEPSNSTESSPSIYPISLPPIGSECGSANVCEQPAEPTVEVEKQEIAYRRPYSAGAPPRPPRSLLRSLSLKGQSYIRDSSSPSSSSLISPDSPQAVLPGRPLSDVRPRSAPQGTPVRSLYL